MSVYYVVYYMFSNNSPDVVFYSQLILMYIVDVIALSGPVCLLLTR